MTISLVIPVYNEERYLPKTLESISRLTRAPDEILVVDGGSTDKTAAVAASMGARVLTTENRGIGFARQQGIENTACDAIAFTDADTILPSNFLTIIEETLAKPGVSGVYGTFRVPDGPLWYRFYINIIQPLSNQFLSWFGVPMASGQALAFWKKDAVAVGGIPKDFKMCEDIEIARRLMTVGKVIYRPDLIVTASGRRGYEGIRIFSRISRAFFYYILFRKADKVGFPSIR